MQANGERKRKIHIGYSVAGGTAGGRVCRSSHAAVRREDDAVRMGHLVSYDNSRLLSAQNAGITELEVELVNPSDPFPKSAKGKAWKEKFIERFNDKRNIEAGGVVPPTELKSKPTLACK